MVGGRICEICGDVVQGRHLARHRSRKHQATRRGQAATIDQAATTVQAPTTEQAATPLQAPPPAQPPTAAKVRTTIPINLYTSVSEVLGACGIRPEEVGDWDIEALNALPNWRHTQGKPKPHRHHTPWRILCDEQLSALPSLESLLIDLTCRARSQEGIAQEAQVFQGIRQIHFSNDDWVAWAKSVLEAKPVPVRTLNIPMGNVISRLESQTYSRRSRELAHQLYPSSSDRDPWDSVDVDNLYQHEANANITPRLTITEVHHDSLPHISTTIGIAQQQQPLKLWLLWPSTELHRLVSYSNTNTALSKMDHGSFLVQMPGESIVVPPNSPHAVLTLNTCYIYGHLFALDSAAYDPSTIHVDIGGNTSPEQACENRLKQLALGLRSTNFRQAYIDHFMETWTMETPIIHDCDRRSDHSNFFHRLVELWAADITEQASCPWCVYARMENISPEIDSSTHARAHLEGRLQIMDDEGGGAMNRDSDGDYVNDRSRLSRERSNAGRRNKRGGKKQRVGN